MKLALALAAGTVAATTMTLTAAATSGSTDPAIGSDDPFVAMLALAPESAAELGSTALIQYTDMASLWRRAGIDGDADERLAGVGDISLVESFPQPPYLFRERLLEQDPLGEVGFAFQHIEQELAVVEPPDDLIVVATSASAAEIATALATDPVWSADLATVSTADGDYFSWGDDGGRVDVARRSTFRPLGRPGFLAVLGEEDATVLRTIGDEPMLEALATTTGRSPSLAESWLFEPVVAALAGRQVLYAAAVPSPTLVDPAAVLLTPGSLLDLSSLPDLPDGLLPYLGVVVVGSVDADGTTDDVQTDVLLVHPSADAAAANVERAEAWLATSSTRDVPFSELLPGASISAEGPLVRVTVPGQEAYLRAVNLLFTRELLPVG